MARRLEYLLYLTCFIDLIGVSFIVPMFGMYLRSIGLSNTLIGVISSGYSAAQLLSGPVVGSWSDTFGRRTVLYVTQLICAFSYFMFTVTTSFSVILFVRIVLGLTKHTQTICKTMVVDYMPLEKQCEVQGKLTAVGGLGFMIGPVVGGHIAELDNGFVHICCITTVMFVVNSIIVYFCFPHDQIQMKMVPNKKPNSMILNLCESVKDLWNIEWRCYWDVFTLKFILGICLSTFYFNYYLFVEETFKISPKSIGYTVSLQGFVSAASGWQIKYFNKFYKDNTIVSSFQKINHCFIILTLSFIVVYISTNIYLFQLCLLPLSGSSSLIRIITTELMFIRSDEQYRGSMMGASNSVSSSTRMIAPLLTGCLQDLVNSSTIIGLGCFLSLSGIYISYVLRSNYADKEKAA